MNYLFPLDTYFAAPLSEVFTDKLAMPVVNHFHSGMAKIVSLISDRKPFDFVSTESSFAWCNRTIQYLNYFGARKPMNLIDVRDNPLSTKEKVVSATLLTVTENTILFVSRTVFRGCLIRGSFALIGNFVAPLFGEVAAESFAENAKFIRIVHSGLSYGVWLITLRDA